MAFNHRHELGRVLLSATLVVAMAACAPVCGIGGKFTLANAHVDAAFNCPNPATRYAYDVHVTMDATNTTSKSVAIKSISETWKNVAVHGTWTGTLGEHGTNMVTTYSPTTLASGSSATIRFAIPFQCTNSGPAVLTYGDFSFSFKVATSAGNYTIKSQNTHRLTTPGG